MLLLHTCCADCVLKFIKAMSEKQQISLYYYNPNIHPRSEYLARLNAIKRIIRDQQLELDLVIPHYRPREYFEALGQKLESQAHPVQAQRCPACWKLRLEKSFEYAKEHDYQSVSTTLLSSHYQQRDAIVAIGQSLARHYELEFIDPGHIDCQLSTAGFYKQNFCGCCFSLTERLRQKYA